VQRVRVSEHSWGCRVELCAPERRNALDAQAVAELRAAFAADGQGALLLCAEGPAFCAGGDLSVLARAAAEGGLAELLSTTAAAFADLIEAIVSCPRPVVAALDGPAVGGGVSLALACDVRLATPRARLVLGWGRLGLPPDGGAAALLGAAVGTERAQALLKESADVTTEFELAPLLFTRIVSAEQLEAESLLMVEQAAKRVDAAALLAELRAQQDEELAALARAAADRVTSERLAVFYKIHT